MLYFATFFFEPSGLVPPPQNGEASLPLTSMRFEEPCKQLMRVKTSITSGANLRSGSFRCSFLALHLVCGDMLQWLAAGSLHRTFQLLRVPLDGQRAGC